MSVTIPEGMASIGNSTFSDCSSLTSVTIPEGVTSIGNSTFSDCSSLTNVTIPESVTSIGNSAFSGCSSLTGIVVPKGVTQIESGTFYNCTNLESVVLPESLQSIKDGRRNYVDKRYIYEGAFTNCSSLKSISIPENAKYIGEYSFYNCSSLMSVTLPECVTSIGNSVFQNCSSLTSVTIPESVTSIGGYAFSGCSSLTSVTIPEGVTSIGYQAFSGCSSLTSVTIPEGVTSIGRFAFKGCTVLKDIYYGGTLSALQQMVSDSGIPSDCALHGAMEDSNSGTCGDGLTWQMSNSGLLTISGIGAMRNYSGGVTPWCAYTEQIASVQIKSGVTSIGSFAFEGCSSLTSVMIPESVTSIGRSAFQDCAALKDIYYGGSLYTLKQMLSDGSIPPACTLHGDTTDFAGDSGECGESLTWTLSKNGTFTVSGTGDMYDYWRDDSYTEVPWSAYSGQITAVVLKSGVTSIGENAFSLCSQLNKLTIPGTVETIGGSAFYGCSSLKSIAIPYGVNEIRESAFSGCSSLSSVAIPGTVRDIGWNAFSNCGSLKSIAIPNGVTEIRNASFAGCSNLTSVKIPNSVTRISYFAFYGCEKLTAINIPNSVTDIGEYAFSNCRSLKSVAIPAGVTCVDEYAFSECTSLTRVTLPKSVELIGGYAFSCCGKLTDVTIPKSVTYIGEGAFSSCSSLTNVVIPEGVTIINKGTFADCNSLTSVTIPQGVLDIGAWAFVNCGKLNSVVIPVGVENIRRAAFAYCIGLTNVTIPKSLTDIGVDAFNNCKRLRKVVYDGLEEDWAQIQIGDGNSDLLRARDYGETEESTVEIRPVATNVLISGGKLTLTAWAMPDSKKVKANWSLSEDSKAYASISSSGVLTAKAVSEVKNITVIATPTDGSPEARKEIQILPKITVKQTEKFNLFYGNGRAKLAITGGQVASARFVEPTDFVLDNNDGQFYIRLAEGASAKPKTKVTLEITLPGCDTPIKQALTVATTNTAPKLKLNPTASIVNTTLTNSLTVETAILGTEDTLTVRCATKGVTASVDNGILTLTLDNGKTTTATVYLKGSDWAKEIRLTHRITVTDKKPTVKLSAKGKLDVLNPASEIVYTPKLTNATGTITDVQLTGEDAKLFNVEVVDGLVHLTLAKSGENYATKKTYKVMPVVTLLGKDIAASTLSIKVTQSALKLAKLPNRTVYQSQTAPLAVKLAVTSPANAKIGDVQLNAKTTAALRNALENAGGINFEADTVTFPASAFAALKPGRYTVILDVTPANAASDTKPIQARFTLTVQK